MTYVLDSWAVLRLLEGAEPAATRVQHVLDAQVVVMSWINLGEVHYVVHRDRGEPAADEVVRDLRVRLDLDLPTEQRVIEAARLKARFRIAYADAFAAATAIAHSATLITGDPELLVSPAPWTVENLGPATS